MTKQGPRLGETVDIDARGVSLQREGVVTALAKHGVKRCRSSHKKLPLSPGLRHSVAEMATRGNLRLTGLLLVCDQLHLVDSAV